MDDAELDEWFAQERERLETAYYTGAEARKDPDALKTAFDTGMRKLVAEYQQRQAKMYSDERRRDAVRKPIARVKARVAQTKQAVAEWRLQQITALRAWWFHRKIKRLLRKG